LIPSFGNGAPPASIQSILLIWLCSMDKLPCWVQKNFGRSRHRANAIKFFTWLAFHGRCWTSDRLHNLPNRGPCALCSQTIEMVDHLLVGCGFSREVWFQVLSSCGLQQWTPSPDDRIAEWWTRARKGIPKARRKCFDSLLILVFWSLWLQRNSRVFRNEIVVSFVLVQHI
jgi:hypothetical protein